MAMLGDSDCSRDGDCNGVEIDLINPAGNSDGDDDGDGACDDDEYVTSIAETFAAMGT